MVKNAIPLLKGKTKALAAVYSYGWVLGRYQ